MNASIEVFKNVISLIILLGLAYHLFFFSTKARFGTNYRYINAWVSGMDVSAHDQRFQGARSQKKFEFFARKEGLSGAVVKSLYVTLSGRYYEIETTSNLCEITGWRITLVPAEDAEAFLASVSI